MEQFMWRWVVEGGICHISEQPRLVGVFSEIQTFGFVKLTAFNHSSLLFEYKKSSEAEVDDSLTISRDYRDVLACVHDCCESITLAT